MAESYSGMVWSGSLWGGGGIDMSWLDGMTGCWGDCQIDSQSVSFSNFKLLDGGETWGGYILYMDGEMFKGFKKKEYSVN